MRWCWMTWFRKGEYSRLSAQHKKMIFDQVSECVQWEYREWKYRKMSEVGGLAYRFSGVQSSSQEQSSWGNYNRAKRVCTVSVNQRATNEEKQHGRKHIPEYPSLIVAGTETIVQTELSCPAKAPPPLWLSMDDQRDTLQVPGYPSLRVAKDQRPSSRLAILHHKRKERNIWLYIHRNH